MANPKPKKTTLAGGAECPFPGPTSYNYDGQKLFFGRQNEIATLASMIMSRRLTVLTAGSGEGKTSLIHAGLTPLFLREGLEVVVVEPGWAGPLAEIAHRALPRLLIEQAPAVRLISALIAKIGGRQTLRDAREYCQGLSRTERQPFLAGEDASRPLHLLDGGALVTWLRDPLIADKYLETAMLANAPSGAVWPGVDAPLTKVVEFSRRLGTEGARAHSIAASLSASELFARIKVAVGRRVAADEDFELVFVIDQFEEIFTQFRSGAELASDPSSDALHQRDELMTFVELMRDERWPLRIVLSLRKEHYTDLQIVLADVEALSAATYHLGPLTTAQAAQCLLGPKDWPRGRPSEVQANAVAAALSSSDGAVTPTLLSVVGEWMWRLPNLQGYPAADLQASIPTAVDDFVTRAFGAEGRRPALSGLDEQEALDMLEDLIVRDGAFERRGSVPAERLIAANFRVPELREHLLRELHRRRLVRRETRLEKEYVEVLHEQLIKSFQRRRENLRRSSRSITRLPELLDDLRGEARGRVRLKRQLDKDLRGVLSANIDRIRLPPALGARTLLRMLAAPDLTSDETHQREGEASSPQRLRQVIRRLADDAAALEPSLPDKGDLADQATRRIEEGRLVSAGEADRLRGDSRVVSTPALAALIFASSLAHHDQGALNRIRHFGHFLRAETTE